MRSRWPLHSRQDPKFRTAAWGALIGGALQFLIQLPWVLRLERDLRVRWALEEIGRTYRVRLLDAMNPRPADYFHEQPFGQVPAFTDGAVHLFESGAILIHLGLQDDRLLPGELNARMRAIAWLIAALNSVEPMLFELINIDIFNRGQEWTKERRPQVVEKIEARLKLLSEALGDHEWFEGRFSIGNMMVVAVLRQLRHTDIVGKTPNLEALLARAEARPAFQRALSDQLSVFAENKPVAEPA